MNILGVSEARNKLPQLVDQVDANLSQLFITKNGRAKAVLMSAEEYESWVETIASYQDKETRKRNNQLKKLKIDELLTLEELKQKLS